MGGLIFFDVLGGDDQESDPRFLSVPREWVIFPLLGSTRDMQGKEMYLSERRRVEGEETEVALIR